MTASAPPSPSVSSPTLTAYYLSGNVMRSRSVGDVVLSGTVDIPEPPARLRADWARELASHTPVAPGDVEVMPLARARTRWPTYGQCVAAVSDWAAALGLPDAPAGCDIALMACRGARYHHDGEQYGGAAFCNLFLSEDKGQDVHFPALDLRIPLRRGTVLVFDPCQPHAVVPRRRDHFDAADFPPEADNTQLFLTWELSIEDARIGRALRVAFDTDAPGATRMRDEHVRCNGEVVSLSPVDGRWQRAG